MGLNEERIQVLKMVESGKLSVEEAAKLLEAMETSASPGTAPAAGFLRIEVMESGRKKASIRIPATLVNLAVGLGQKFWPGQMKDMEGLDLQAILDAVRQGGKGKILEVEEPEKQQRVEISLE